MITKPLIRGMKSFSAPSIICDIDGTLYDFTGNPYNRDFTQDTIVKPVADLLARFADHNIILFSGRAASAAFEATVSNLDRDGVAFDALYMRKEFGAPSDDILKQDMLFNFQMDFPKSDIAFIVDDRPKVVRMWRSKGFFVFDVNQRNDGKDF